MTEIPFLLLAAGSSSRMGQAKQLLPWGNQTLIEHQIHILQKTGNPVVVILGANAELIVPIIEKTGVAIIFNPNWETGMGSSISAGIAAITENFPAAEGVLITLLDQPFVTADHLGKMLRNFSRGKQQIVVSKADSGWMGVPALFDCFYFEELERLCGNEGAKTVIKQYTENALPLECRNILEDLDTPEKYEQLLKKYLTAK